jgi:hypothetical protein
MVADEEKEESKGFKVQDRRRFSAEGELKPEHRGPDERQDQLNPQPSTAAAADPAGTNSTAAAAAQAERVASHTAHLSSQHSQPAPEINFGSFVVGLSTQALVHLGEIPDPLSDQPAQDLSAAQQVIDIVAMLEQKTRGNLDRDEQALLEAILFELRMKYVERARR